MTLMRRPPGPRHLARPSQRSPRSAGIWYFGVVIVSVGLLAAVPFWHAWMRIRRPSLRVAAVAYTLVDVVLAIGLAVTSDPSTYDETWNAAISTLCGLGMFAVVAVACVHLTGVRRAVMAAPAPESLLNDPAVERLTAARHRRAEARALWASDPALARQLGIGRPDLAVDFDDGGLVELNTAPAEAFTSACGMDPVWAQRIVAARDARDGGYFNVAELFIDVALPDSVREEVEERALI